MGQRITKPGHQRVCRQCKGPVAARTGPLLCSKKCRQLWYEQHPEQRPGYARNSSANRKESEIVKISKKLAFTELYDPVRDILREEVRATITQHAKDNVLGMTEMLTDLLPIVYAGLARDAMSEDDYIRQKAQAIILKYVMPLNKEEVAADDSRVINIIHNVPIPDTKFGHDVEGELVALPPGVEAFEQDWPVCYTCNERKHPDNGSWMKLPNHPNPGWQCNACTWRDNIRKGNTDPTSIMDPITRNPEPD